MISCYIEAGQIVAWNYVYYNNLEVDNFKVQVASTTNYNRPYYSFRPIVTTYVHIMYNTVLMNIMDWK